MKRNYLLLGSTNEEGLAGRAASHLPYLIFEKRKFKFENMKEIYQVLI
jgi:hypothetical protein